jgi:hypothetical protein
MAFDEVPLGGVAGVEVPLTEPASIFCSCLASLSGVFVSAAGAGGLAGAAGAVSGGTWSAGAVVVFAGAFFSGSDSGAFFSGSASGGGVFSGADSGGDFWAGAGAAGAFSLGGGGAGA